MSLPKTQECPFCNHLEEDCYANWEEEEQDVVCDWCKKTYSVRAEYKFEGFEIKRICQRCNYELQDGEKEYCLQCDL